MKLIGLTGGIGSGKSTVAKIFEALDVSVYYADDEAKKLYVTHPEMKAKIIENFGAETYTDNQLNRAYLSSQVFGDKNKLALLNSIVHPELEKHFQTWLNQNQDRDYVLKEAAILIEMKGHESCDKIIVVTAPENVRIQRVIARDQTDELAVKNRINKQLSEEERNQYADFIIDNSGNKMLIPQVMKIHESIIQSIGK